MSCCPPGTTTCRTAATPSSTSCTGCRRPRRAIAGTTGSSRPPRRQARRSSCSHRARATSTAIRSISTGVRDGTGRRSSRPSSCVTSTRPSARPRNATPARWGGISAGGYGATIIGLNHLDRFSVIESWSGYFHPTDPTGTKALARGPLAIAHRLIPELHREQRRHGTLFAFYVGRGDARFAAEHRELDRELRTTGTRHLFAAYPGGHDAELWQAHAQAWLQLALSRLAGPRR
ncbi:MAG: alpha/beta hydrolase-fold protein [Actinomycetota bacterium]